MKYVSSCSPVLGLTSSTYVTKINIQDSDSTSNAGTLPETIQIMAYNATNSQATLTLQS
jgi:hypothetical protein